MSIRNIKSIYAVEISKKEIDRIERELKSTVPGNVYSRFELWKTEVIDSMVDDLTKSIDQQIINDIFKAGRK
jgi:hypothetical protein